jgi:hypothetical protein
MLNPIVQVFKRQTQTLAQSPADGGFAGPHKTNQEHRP